MKHHAFFFAGDLEKGVEAAHVFAEQKLGVSPFGNPDVIHIRYGLFSVEDARKITELAHQSPIQGTDKILIVSASRLFHEAQNAVLKLFEEPPQGTTLILVLPSEGILLPTLRSRLLPLPGSDAEEKKDEVLNHFSSLTEEERKKYVEKLADRSKSDRPEAERNAARLEALLLAEGLMRAGYRAKVKGDESEDLSLFLGDLDRFIPILHERSGPLKLIFEHLLLTLPSSLHAKV